MRSATLAAMVALSATTALAGNDDAVARAKDLMRYALADPGSAQYRDVQVAALKEGGYLVCGLVNAKNRLGAFTGFDGFSAELSARPEKSSLVVVDGGKTLVKVVETCKNQGIPFNKDYIRASVRRYLLGG